MSFHDILFPMRLARGAIGGPLRRTNIYQRKNGQEVRIANNSKSLRQWQISSKNSNLDDLAFIVAFFEARMGKLYSFRFNDPFDNKSCAPSLTPTAFDQKIGTGDGVKKDFQLIKNYGDSANNYARIIDKPILNSVLVAIGNTQALSSAFSVNYQTGIVSFLTAPAAGQAISAGFKFDTKVRFDNEQLELSLDGQGSGHIADIILKEVIDA